MEGKISLCKRTFDDLNRFYKPGFSEFILNDQKFSGFTERLDTIMSMGSLQELKIELKEFWQFHVTAYTDYNKMRALKAMSD